MPLIFLNEVNKTLDKEGQALFKETLTRYKTGQLTDIDQLTDQILSAFLKGSLGAAMSEE